MEDCKERGVLVEGAFRGVWSVAGGENLGGHCRVGVSCGGDFVQWAGF